MWIGLGLIPGFYIIRVSCELVSLDGIGGNTCEEKQNVAALSSTVRLVCILWYCSTFMKHKICSVFGIDTNRKQLFSYKFCVYRCRLLHAQF